MGACFWRPELFWISTKDAISMLMSSTVPAVKIAQGL
jgi:hypothetical protein